MKKFSALLFSAVFGMFVVVGCSTTITGGTADDHQATADDHQATADDHQATADDHQATADDHQ